MFRGVSLTSKSLKKNPDWGSLSTSSTLSLIGRLLPFTESTSLTTDDKLSSPSSIMSSILFALWSLVTLTTGGIAAAGSTSTESLSKSSRKKLVVERIAPLWSLALFSSTVTFSLNPPSKSSKTTDLSVFPTSFCFSSTFSILCSADDCDGVGALGWSGSNREKSSSIKLSSLLFLLSESWLLFISDQLARKVFCVAVYSTTTTTSVTTDNQYQVSEPEPETDYCSLGQWQ